MFVPTRLVGHPFGKKFFGDHNLIYLMGQDHMVLRRCIAPNFTPSALSTYTSLQQIIIVDHLRCWLARSSSSGGPIALRIPARDLNLETSQSVFVGPYLSDDAQRRFAADYNLFNVGLMKLPFDLPGFAFQKARLAVGRLVDTLSACVAESNARMDKGEEQRCLIDFWMQETAKEVAAAREEGAPPPPGDHRGTTSGDEVHGGGGKGSHPVPATGDNGPTCSGGGLQADGVVHDPKGDDRVPVRVRFVLPGVPGCGQVRS